MFLSTIYCLDKYGDIVMITSGESFADVRRLVGQYHGVMVSLTRNGKTCILKVTRGLRIKAGSQMSGLVNEPIIAPAILPFEQIA